MTIPRTPEHRIHPARPLVGTAVRLIALGGAAGDRSALDRAAFGLALASGSSSVSRSARAPREPGQPDANRCRGRLAAGHRPARRQRRRANPGRRQRCPRWRPGPGRAHSGAESAERRRTVRRAHDPGSPVAADGDDAAFDTDHAHDNHTPTTDTDDEDDDDNGGGGDNEARSRRGSRARSSTSTSSPTATRSPATTAR